MRRAKYVPKHRNAPPEVALKRGLRKSVTYSGVAVAATGIAVTGGVAAKQEPAPADTAAATIASAQVERADLPAEQRSDVRSDDRSEQVSRSDRRTSTEKEQALAQESGGQATRTEDLADQDPRDIARQLMGEYGLDAGEFDCLDDLWVGESDWDPTADNPTSTAYGIPQALTGGTHDNLPADYMTNPVSQIRWGLWYIKNSYGTACAALEFKNANNWY